MNFFRFGNKIYKKNKQTSKNKNNTVKTLIREQENKNKQTCETTKTIYKIKKNNNTKQFKHDVNSYT